MADLFDNKGNKVGSVTRRGPSNVSGGYDIWDKHDHKVGTAIPRGPRGNSGSDPSGIFIVIIFLSILILAIVVLPIAASFVYPLLTSVPRLFENKENLRHLARSYFFYFWFSCWIVYMKIFFIMPLAPQDSPYGKVTGMEGYFDYYFDLAVLLFTPNFVINLLNTNFIVAGQFLAYASMILSVLFTGLLVFTSIKNNLFYSVFRATILFWVGYFKGWLEYWPWLIAKVKELTNKKSNTVV